jgi:hypothetical protein
MTITYIDANSIDAGPRFSFAASGDSLVILPGITMASTTGSAISSGGFVDLDVTVLGTLASAAQIIMAEDSALTVTDGGQFIGLAPAGGSAAFFVLSSGNTVNIDG